VLHAADSAAPVCIENIFTQALLPLNMAVLNITARFSQANPLHALHFFGLCSARLQN